MAFVGFDAKTITPSSGGSFELLPRGRYLATCIDSEMKTNQAKTGEYLKLTFEIVEGSYKGRKLFEQLNIRHPNTKAVEIALSTLSALCHATGVLELGDSAMLHNIPVLLEVGVEKGRDGYDDRNRIYGYAKAGEEKTPNLAPPFTPFKAAPKAPPAAPAWSKAPIQDDDIPF